MAMFDETKLVPVYVFISGHDGMGPWDPGLYGPFPNYKEAEKFGERYKATVTKSNEDMPRNEWSFHYTTLELTSVKEGIEEIEESEKATG